MGWLRAAGIASAAGAGLATEIVTVRAGVPVDVAALDLAAGWSLLVAAGWAHVSRACRWWCAAAAVLWFGATWGALDTAAGHVAAQLATAWLAPLACALLAAPRRWPASLPARGVLALVAVRAVAPVIAADPRVTAVAGVALAAVAAPGAVVWPRLRGVRFAAVVLGLATVLVAVLQLVDRPLPRPDLVISGVVVLCGSALVLARPGPLTRRGDVARLVIDLGRSRDARSHQQLLADALGDPQARLLYRLAPGSPLVDVAGRPGGPPPPGRVITVMDDPAGSALGVSVGLEHAAAALEDPRVRAAVAAVAALLARRLQAAAAAATQAAELAESRRRLVAAEDAERRRFARSVDEGPGRSLARAMSVLETAAVASGSLPEEVERTLHQAADQAVAAYQELAATVHGDLALLLARRGPAAVLADLASSAGASAQIDGGLDAALTGRAGVGVAQVAWFVAAEGLTNALRHAGAARLRLTAGCDGDRVVVEVVDDGIGGADPAGRGLSGLRLRAAEVGGHLTVSPGPDGGTVVRAELPFSRPGSTGSP